MEDKKYSENFSASEFDYVEPEEDLLNVLQAIRNKTGDSVVITSGPRNPKDHVRIYMDLEKNGNLGDKKWYDAIPWGSRHLPTFGTGKLRAVDIKAVKSRGDDNEVKEYYKGSEIHEMINDIKDELSLYLGIGVGKEYCHIDVDRKSDALWHYNY